MSPNKKANELISSFINIMPPLADQTGKKIIEHAKNSALQVTKEIIKSQEYLGTVDNNFLVYWVDVQLEISKLYT